MTVRRRLFRAAAGSLTVLACGLLAACDSTAHATPSAAATAAIAAPSPTPSVKTLPPSQLCTVLTAGVARRIVPDARLAARVSPNKGAAPDVCDYTSADGRSTLSLTPASRTYAAELSAAHNLAANPSSAGMRDVQVDAVSGLGRQAFRETAYQTQAKQQLTFVVWKAGSRNWVLTYATAANTPSAPATVSDDKVTGAARSITAKLPTGK
ncbi:hypothetical protein OG194_33895 [Streptomyces sp. NBC_01288]|uniref:hypothetical protein n=1 Tax=Streptomyces sp. NBC_01288 TaxID=2903814 RepID=UPI002E130D5E|nr:hypothetical protein OG194_33895 [Streptomyces sp. NBC_01288]